MTRAADVLVHASLVPVYAVDLYHTGDAPPTLRGVLARLAGVSYHETGSLAVLEHLAQRLDLDLDAFPASTHTLAVLDASADEAGEYDAYDAEEVGFPLPARVAWLCPGFPGGRLVGAGRSFAWTDGEMLVVGYDPTRVRSVADGVAAATERVGTERSYGLPMSADLGAVRAAHRDVAALLARRADAAAASLGLPAPEEEAR